MTVAEKVAYLQGLMEGQKIDKDTDQGKILHLMAQILGELAEEVTECQDDIDDINEYLEAVDEDLTTVEEELFGEDFCDCDCEDDDCCCDGCEDDECYEVVCPHCGNAVCFEEEPEGESFPCPSCTKEIPLGE